MSGSTIRELVGQVWATAHSSEPQQEKQQRYRLLIDQIEAHFGKPPDNAADSRDAEAACRIRDMIESLMSDSGSGSGQ